MSMSTTLLYTTGHNQEVYTFVNVAEKDMWEAEVLGIKADSTSVFNKKENSGLTSAVRALYKNWMSRVHAFKNKYSEGRTPMDIKWALNTAEEALGMSVTQWDNPPDGSVFE